MKTILSRLEKALLEQFPDILATLNLPATEDQIRSFEAAVNQKLPQDIKDSYLWHNGCRCDPEDATSPAQNKAYFLINKGRWLSLDEVLDQWRFQNELAEGEDYSFTEIEDPKSWEQSVIRPWSWAPPTWLPISRQGHQSHVYIDLLPGPKGQVGQLLDHHIQGDSQLIATSFECYLTIFAAALEHGHLEYDRNHQQWVGLEKAFQNFENL
jgi:cell wall assembly regulator SMI1